MLVVAMLGAAFTATADAKLSKAQKHAISKTLMRAVKKNPRVISKRWFLKKASLVSFSLPSTIRLDPFAGQNGERVTTGSDAYPRSRAILDLGPSLGVRTIPLSGSLHANINFNDAFDGGHLGDVRISLPPDPSATLSTTAVPLLTNTNVTNNTGNADAPNDEINGFAIAPNPNPPGPPGPGALIMLKVNGDPTPHSVAGGYDATFTTCANFSYSAFVANSNSLTPSVAAACGLEGKRIQAALAASPAIGSSAKNVYVASIPAAVAAKNNAATGALAVHTVFVGDYNETVVGGIFGLAAPTGGFAPVNPTGTMLIQYPYQTGTSTIQVDAHTATRDQQGMGGCGNWEGNGFMNSPPRAAQDVDDPANIVGTNVPGNDNSVGTGAVSPDPGALPGDVVLRTGALSLHIAAPTQADVPGDNEDNPGSTLAAPYTTGTVITVQSADAAAFSPGQTLSITDGFNSDTAKIDTAENAVGNTGIIQLSAVAGPDNTLISSTNDYATGSLVSVTGDAVVSKSIGSSGGRANLFGQPINGLAKGNSVDVTVNLATDIHSIAREVDSSPAPFGGPSVDSTVATAVSSGSLTLDVATGTGASFAAGEVIAIGGGTNPLTDSATIASIAGDTLTLQAPGLTDDHAVGDYVSYTPETQGNINTYSTCRQAWTGKVRNYLTGIKLVGSLRIAPALTADGKVRIAKVNLRTPAPVAESLAACLTPYQLFMEGVPGLALDPGSLVAPNLIGGAIFNPLVVLAGSSEGVSEKPDVDCNSQNGPLDRHPFNVEPNGTTDLKSMLENGAAVGVSGTIRTAIKAEVIIGSFDE
jgi:hypothetical protein